MTTLTSPPSHVLQSAVFGRLRLWLLPLTLALLLAGGLSALLTPFPAAAAGPLCYVDADASGAATGLNWTDAYTTVQDALADATCTEIWVAEGVYYPDEGAGQTNNVITSTFALTNGVALYGGFDGTETQRGQRDPAANITVLSGDIDKNDTTDPNGVVTDTANIVGANAYHVVTGSGTDDTAVLDGFTITAGQANGPSSPDYYGGGMYNDAGSPRLTNVTFSGNLASYHGGGIYNSNSNPALSDVTFSANSASYYGGGMYNRNNSSPMLTNVTFSANSADTGGGMYNNNSNPALADVTFSANSASQNDGGGVFNINSNPTLTDVTFSDNSASQNGGGMYNYASSPVLTSVTFSNNSAFDSGGGVYNAWQSSPALTDITFSANSATYGGGMYTADSSPALTDVTFSTNSADYGGGMYNSNSDPALTDVTFSANSASSDGGGMYNSGSSPTLTNVTISGNSASGGGGMFNYYQSNPALTEVTFSANSAYYGGGMRNWQSSPTLTNVTFSDNSAGFGGGMYNYEVSSPTLTNVTFSGNSASNSGGGMYNLSYNGGYPSSPTLTNVIIANSTSGGDCVNGTNSSIAAGSANNLIEDSANACGLTNGTDGNIIGSDPKLGPLTDYGGPGKQVFPLLLGSPAIDAGTSTDCPATDQRGTARPIGATCDIGAYELDTFSLVIAKSADNPTPLPGQTITFTVVVTNTGPLVTNGLLSDTLPAGLNFLGPVTLEPHGAGTISAAPSTLASSLTISANRRITVTFPVTVSRGLAAGTALTNTAAISATEIPTPTRASAVVTVPNVAPVANAGAPQTVNPGDSVTLDGSGSSDPNGDTLAYLWQQTGGVTVMLSDATSISPTFTAPAASGMLTFTLTVTDTGGLTDTTTTTVTVKKYCIYLPLVLKP